MTDFDQQVRPMLNRIQAEAQTIETHARHIVADAKLLQARPYWETKAEDAMAEAETRLWSALHHLRTARERYARTEPAHF